MKQAMLKKKCDRCGTTQPVPRNRRRCHERRFGEHSYCCWGSLKKVQPKKRVVPVERKRAKLAADLELYGHGLDAARRQFAHARNGYVRARRQLRDYRRKVAQAQRALARLPVAAKAAVPLRGVRLEA